MCTCAFFVSLYMDIGFFHRILSIDSTSGKEDTLADMLAVELAGPGRHVETFDVGDGTKNLIVSWGTPKVMFCTHLDTVPPYIPPVLKDISSDTNNKKYPAVHGRGACDAKGQISAMYEACKVLESKGYTDFGLLLLSGEETGSHGAKAFSKAASSLRTVIEDDCVIVVGEPTDNFMASAAKGTKAFEVTFSGAACHSGYPENGQSAVLMFNDFVNALRSIVFPKDDTLGDTTWNIGKLVSDNPQNILSDRLTCRIYFRTTFESDEMVCNVMKNIAGPEARLRFGKPKVQDGSDIVAKDIALWQRSMSVKSFGGDSPTRFLTLEGFPTKPVSFGSDAPHLTCFKHKILCGPGSILTAHTANEYITLQELETAVENYVRIYETITKIL